MPISQSEEIQQEILSATEKMEAHQAAIEQQTKRKEKIEEELQSLANDVSLIVDHETGLSEQYKTNISAFENYFPDVALFFKTYQPQNKEVFIHENFANIIDTRTNAVVYEYPAYLMALKQFETYQTKPQSTHSKFFAHDEGLGEFLHSEQLNKIIQLHTERADVEQEKNKNGSRHSLPKYLNALVMFGVGLGYHIELMSKSHNLGSVYLIEPDLDVFYASLYTANWQQILSTIEQKGGSLHLSLGPQDSDFFDNLLAETYVNGRYEVAKTFGYIHNNSPEILGLVTEYKTRFFEMIQGWGFFDDGIMAISHFLQSVKDGVPIMKKNVEFDLDIATAPVFIVGNGPSLDQSIELLKQQKDKAIIISCGSALSALYKYGIEVDFHCEQERIFAVAEKIDYYAPKEYIEKQTLLTVSTVHPEVYKKFARALMSPKGSEPSTDLLLQDKLGKELFESALYITPTVANTAMVMAVQMGFKQFYLMGIDLGHKEDGAHHSQHSFYYDESGDDIDLYPKTDTQFLREGNFGGEFTADPIFNMSRVMLEKVIFNNQSLKVFNLSDGAKIEGAMPLSSDDVNLNLEIDKSYIVDKALELSSYKDNGDLVNRLEIAADIEGFKELCHTLFSALDKEVGSIKEGAELLRSLIFIMREKLTPQTKHFASLINGSMQHMQAMLIQLLYVSNDEKIALGDFNEGLSHYREFLNSAPVLYKKQYNKPLYKETSHLDALRKLS